jgi:hypothetical protein
VVVLVVPAGCGSFGEQRGSANGPSSDAGEEPSPVIAGTAGSVAALSADDRAVYWASDVRLFRWTPTDGARVIAYSRDVIRSLSIHPSWVAWLSSDGLYAIGREVVEAGPVGPVDGGEITTGLPARELAIAGSSVYFTNRMTLGRFELGTALVSACQLSFAPSHPSFDGARIVLLGTSDGGVSLYESPLSTCAPPVSLTDTPPSARGLVADALGQYWIDERGVASRSEDGVSIVLGADELPRALSLNAGTLYIATATKVLAYVRSRRTLEVVASSQKSPTAIAATSSTVYWATLEDSSIWRAPTRQ